jgi:hypothetical protein
MDKIPFTMKLSPEIVERLRRLARDRKTCLNDTVSLALAALERERETGNSLPDRVGHLEKNISAFFNLVMTFNEKLEEKFSHADLYEKERLKSLYQLLKEHFEKSDQAQEARVSRVLDAVGRLDRNPP